MIATVRKHPHGFGTIEVFHPVGAPTDSAKMIWTQVDLDVERTIVPEVESDTSKTLVSFMRGGDVTGPDGSPGYGSWSEDEPFSECHCNGMKCLIFLSKWTPVENSVLKASMLRPVDPFYAILKLNEQGQVEDVPLRIEGEDGRATLPLEACLSRIRAARAAAGLR